MAYACSLSIIYIMNTKRLNKVKIEWSPKFAYAMGLMATDGNLSKDGRHMNMTSKDKAMIETFKKCLGIDNKIGTKTRGNEKIKRYFQVQFGDKNFYEFLVGIGLTPAKSKTLGQLQIPKQFFIDFLRGCIDGDGSIGSFQHPESKQPQLRLSLYSASKPFLAWTKDNILGIFKITGGWLEDKKNSGVYKLAYGKADSIKLLKLMYYSDVENYLERKYEIAKIYL